MRAVFFLMLAACWTGTVVEPPPEPQAPKSHEHADVDLEIRVQQGACLGMCPVYDVAIHHDGLLHYNGQANVTEKGVRTRRLTRTQMIELSRAVDHVQFFELDETGQHSGCVTANGTTTCSFGSTFCADTSHTIITVDRPHKHQSHMINDAHCGDGGEIEPLEQKIQELVAPWIRGN